MHTIFSVIQVIPFYFIPPPKYRNHILHLHVTLNETVLPSQDQRCTAISHYYNDYVRYCVLSEQFCTVQACTLQLHSVCEFM